MWKLLAFNTYVDPLKGVELSKSEALTFKRKAHDKTKLFSPIFSGARATRWLPGVVESDRSEGDNDILDHKEDAGGKTYFTIGRGIHLFTNERDACEVKRCGFPTGADPDKSAGRMYIKQMIQVPVQVHPQDLIGAGKNKAVFQRVTLPLEVYHAAISGAIQIALEEARSSPN
jgi:hypothetical protein